MSHIYSHVKQILKLGEKLRTEIIKRIIVKGKSLEFERVCQMSA